MPKKPRMPKSATPAKKEPEHESAEDAVILEKPTSVTNISSHRKTAAPETDSTSEEPDEEEVEPAPRSKMRERLLASAKRDRRTKQRKTKRFDDDIWHRDDRAASFDDRPEPARQFSGRAVALLAVLFIAALIMAQPLQLLLEQQADITHAQQQLDQENEREQELETQLQRWEDPAFVQQQARERFNMVMPGEHQYLVIDDEEDKVAEPDPGVAPLDEDVELGWADRLWGSVLSSGQE